MSYCGCSIRPLLQVWPGMAVPLRSVPTTVAVLRGHVVLRLLVLLHAIRREIGVRRPLVVRHVERSQCSLFVDSTHLARHPVLERHLLDFTRLLRNFLHGARVGALHMTESAEGPVEALPLAVEPAGAHAGLAAEVRDGPDGK